MPSLDLVAEHAIHEPVLLDDAQPAELLAHNVQRVHGPAAAGDVLDFEPCRRELRQDEVVDFGFAFGQMRGGREGGGVV